MKKQRLKKWVEVVLSIIAMLSVCIIGSDCEDLSIFVISHLIALIIFTLSIKVLVKYSR